MWQMQPEIAAPSQMSVSISRIECGEGQAETKLEARCDAARQGSGKAADDARDAENQEHRTAHQTGTGYCRRVIGSINIAADAAFIGCTAMGTP